MGITLTSCEFCGEFISPLVKDHQCKQPEQEQPKDKYYVIDMESPYLFGPFGSMEDANNWGKEYLNDEDSQWYCDTWTVEKLIDHATCTK